jgi:hypothetical protein
MSSTQTPGYRTLSPDTAEWADRMLFEHWAGMPPTEKADLVSELCLSAHRLTLLGLSRLYPEASPRELELREACRRLGRDVVEQVLGHPLPFPDST